MTLRLEEIMHMLQRNLLFAVIVTAIICLISFLFYRFIYVRKFASDRRWNEKQLIGYMLFVVYIVCVCALTLLNRGVHYEGSVNLALFSSYREAWYEFSLRDWQYIYFNIAMFVPFGIFLPLLFKRFSALRWTLLATLLFTAFIEILQYITGVGIFELDDLFNNLLGALIGFGLVKAVTLKELRLRMLSLMPLLLVIGLSIALFTYYEHKEFGNLAIVPVNKVKMDNVQLTAERTFTDNHPVKQVYKAPSLTKDEAAQKADELFKNLNVDTSEIEVIDYQNEANYRYNGEPSYFIWLHYLDGSYEITDFSSFDVKFADTNKQALLAKLQKMGIIVPEQAQFKRKKLGHYIWEIKQAEQENHLFDGTLEVEYYQDNTIKNVVNNIVTYEKVKEIKLKSEQQAYQEILAGKFNVVAKNIHEIRIQQVKLTYELDSKGFYQPVYAFISTIDGEKNIIYIPGIDA